MGFDLTLPQFEGMYLRDAIGGTITDADEGNRQVQVTFPHDTVDTFKTTFDKDAFRSSFEKRLPLMCWQHDLRDPIGHAISAQVTPKSNEIVGKFDDFDAVPNAKRAFSQINSGTITDFSFGFRQPKYENHKRFAGVRNIRSAIMMEFSPVSIGSIPGAVATGLREEDIEMAEQSLTAQDIIEAVRAELLSPEEGKRMLAQLDGFRDHITLRSPEQIRVETLEAELAGLRAGTTTVTNITTAPAPVEPTVDAPTGTAGEAEFDLREENTALKTRVAEFEARDAAVPTVINAENLLTVLPEAWRSALDGAAIAVAPAGTQFFREADQVELEENCRTIAGAIDAANAKAAEWTANLERADLSDDLQNALQLYEAAATSAGALLDVLGGERAMPKAADGTPVSQTQAEDMAPTAVKCSLCTGTGTGADGKTCERCMGSGVEALSREDGEEYVAPEVRSDGFDVRFVSEGDRREMAKSGVAMSNGDFPIPDKGHLQSALGHIGNYKGDRAAAKAHIQKRAKALGVSLSDGDFPETRDQYDGDGDKAVPPESANSTDERHGEEGKRLQQAAIARLNKHATKDEKTSIDKKGAHPDLGSKTTDKHKKGMPDPVNHTPPASATSSNG